jgi:hypothetical protein
VRVPEVDHALLRLQLHAPVPAAEPVPAMTGQAPNTDMVGPRLLGSAGTHCCQPVRCLILLLHASSSILPLLPPTCRRR